jgi:Flp pilus assembly protein TadB
VPDVAETPDEAREIDYGVRASIAGIWLMTAYSVPLFSLGILLSHATPILLAAPAGLLIAAIGLHIYLRRSQRRRLVNFISPINGVLHIPGGRRDLKLRNLIRRKAS